ncbi:unnamed protein product, partial [marine sediment metagenome]
KNIVLEEYRNVYDYQGTRRPLVQEVEVELEESTQSDKYNYIRVIPPRQENGKQEYVLRDAKLDSKGEEIEPRNSKFLQGIIIATKKITMRTDGIVVESLLGRANALDDYSVKYRKEKIRDKKHKTNRIKAETQKINVGLEIIKELLKQNKLEQAKNAYREFFGFQEGLKSLTEILGPQVLELERVERRLSRK